MTTLTLDGVNADLQNTKASVPTLEEQLCSTVLTCWKSGSDTPISVVPWSFFATLMVAPIALKVLSVGVSFEYWSLAASDTSYWTASLETGSASAGFTVAATRTTQNTGANANGGITARQPWTFDAAVTPTGPIGVPAGQVFGISWGPTGTPANMKLPATFTIRYAAA